MTNKPLQIIAEWSDSVQELSYVVNEGKGYLKIFKCQGQVVLVFFLIAFS